MSKKKQGLGAPSITINITPEPLEGNAFIVQKPMTDAERAAFKLAWERMNKETGEFRVVLILPEGVELETLTTPHLRHLQKNIEAILKERGEQIEFPS